jgi:hypothetical protein
MEANTNSVIEHKLIVLNSKEDGDKLNGEYLSHVRFNFRDILKGRRYILCGYVSSISRNTVFFYNINVNNSTLNYSVNSTDYSLLTEGIIMRQLLCEFVSQFNSGDTVILFLCLSIK